MTIDGYGGRGGYDQTDYVGTVLKGLIGFDDSPPRTLTFCSNPKCKRLYFPRAEGDDYCNERCDPLNKLNRTEVSKSD